MNKFEIIETSGDEVFVTILGTGNFGEFLYDLEKELHHRNYREAKVFLDMFLRHGIDNRFFFIPFYNRKLKIDSIDQIELNVETQNIYNKYILFHQEILSLGLLSCNQQLRFLEYIKRSLDLK